MSLCLAVVTCLIVALRQSARSGEKKKFGQNVVRLRHKAGLTQERLAEAAEISTRHLQSIEAGMYWPQLPTLRKLRKALHVSWETLCE